MTYVASIGTQGATYYLPYHQHSWAIVGGFFAPVQGWVVPKEIADQIMTDIGTATGIGREVVLQLGDPANLTRIKRVYVLGVAPGGNPQQRTMLLTDVRWYLTNAVFVMDVNLRSHIGNKRLLGGILKDAVVVDPVAYHVWSLNLGYAYDWASLRDQVLASVTAAKNGRPAIQYVVDKFNTLTVPPQVVQESSADGPALFGLASAIESVPGASLYPDKDGVLHVYEAVAGAEIPLLSALQESNPVLWNHGDLQIRDRSGERPSLWRVLVDLELEVRFTCNLTGEGLGSKPASTDPFLIPVLKVTDKELTIPAGSYGFGAQGSMPVAQGSWIPQAAAYAAWGTSTFGPTKLPQLTDTIVANYWFGDGLRSWSVGTKATAPEGGDGVGNPAKYDQIWGARIQSVLASFRTHFQINPLFWDNVRHAWLNLSSIFDTATGTRAPSPVYVNYGYMSTNARVSALDSSFFTNNTSSYPDANGQLISGYPSGFEIRWIDEEQGIIAIDRGDLSKFPGIDFMAPSPVKNEPGLGSEPPYLDPARAQLIPMTGTTGFKLATVISCAPAAPNSLERLYEIQVSIADAVGAAGLKSTPLCFGPDQELRSQLTEARIAWQDVTTTPDDEKSKTAGDLILDVIASGISVKNFVPGPASSVITIGGYDSATPDPASKPKTIGLVPINMTNELIPLGQAVAAADLLTKLDCYVGSMAIPMGAAPDGLVPLGSIQQVIYTVEEHQATVSIHCDAHEPPLRAEDFLKGSARTTLLKQIAKAGR